MIVLINYYAPIKQPRKLRFREVTSPGSHSWATSPSTSHGTSLHWLFILVRIMGNHSTLFLRFYRIRKKKKAYVPHTQKASKTGKLSLYLSWLIFTTKLP